MTITDAQCYETTSGTTLTGTVDANAGDFILATISHRSTFTTPSGWTKIYESTATLTVNQKMVFAIKQVEETGAVSFTATQSSAGRIYLNLVSIGGISGIESANEYEAYSETAVTSIAVPNKTAGDMLIWGCTAPTWATSNFGQWSTSPNDLELIQLPSTTQPRQLNAVDDGTGQATGRSFIPNPGSGGTTLAIAAVKLLPQVTHYKSSGSAIYEVQTGVESLGDSTVTWLAETPLNTSVAVSVSLDGLVYEPCTDGQSLPFDRETDISTIYFKVELATSDTTVTPTLLSLSLTAQDARFSTFTPAGIPHTYKIYCDISNRVMGITVLNKKTSLLRFLNNQKVPVFSIHFFVEGLLSYKREDFYDVATFSGQNVGGVVENIESITEGIVDDSIFESAIYTNLQGGSVYETINYEIIPVV